MSRECCNVLIHVLKAGKESNWSLSRSEVRLMGTSGLLSGRVKVDISALGALGKTMETPNCLANNRVLMSMQEGLGMTVLEYG